ncbi:Ubiquitin-like protein 3 [Lamellibrachia satsuma]|nr:Ubiquitin-like protein 3 [Lamellibrachia satsuma]
MKYKVRRQDLKDQINLRLILVSGKTKEFLFSPSNSAADITQHVYDSWPQEWTDEQPPTTNILRLIYQGRFLHGNVTLGALQLPLGKTTVMHLVARENLPEPNNQGQLKKDKSGEGTCSNCCAIL